MKRLAIALSIVALLVATEKLSRRGFTILPLEVLR